MSTFGEDLIQSLNEALAHTKGEGPDGNEPVRLPKMGAGNAPRQRPGRGSPAHHSARTQRGQACTTAVAMKYTVLGRLRQAYRQRARGR